MSFTGFDQHITDVLAEKYKILNLQGKGGMANVYRAIQIGLDREVAIKIIHPSLINDEDTIKRFKLEAKAAAKLSHPNIITVYDVGEASEIVYICLEFLDGIDLAEQIRNEGRLRVDQLLNIMMPIASALDEIHSHSLIHRDIKSSNIFITKKGKPILLDFGIATFKESSSGTTLPGTVIGTPEYMSPEQANGRSVGPESDIYSLGVVMFQCLSGNVPFAGDSPISTLVKISQGMVPELDQHSLEIPQWLYDIVMKCLAADPEKRFRSAHDLLDSLKSKKITESNSARLSNTANYDAEIVEINKRLNNSKSIDDRIETLKGSGEAIREIYRLEDEIDYLLSIKKFQSNLNKKYQEAPLSAIGVNG
jgi:serine/threonine-protein kinase